MKSNFYSIKKKLIVPIILAQFFLFQTFILVAFAQSGVINSLESNMQTFGPGFMQDAGLAVQDNIIEETQPTKKQTKKKAKNEIDPNSANDKTFANKRIIRKVANANDPIGLVGYEPEEVTHIFFHTLTVDPKRAYKSAEAKGYNSNMATVDEFKKILQQLYDNNYCLVKLHDLASIKYYENGSLPNFVKKVSTASNIEKAPLRNPIDPKQEKSYTPYEVLRKKVYVPIGKTPLIISQDDVNYYHYMDGSGHANRLVIDNGEIKAAYKDKSGNELIGDYDLIPILDSFIKEHPDFSYNGARAIIALTGYNGVFGYRTDETYDINSSYFKASNKKTPNENIEEDREYARRIAKVLHDRGYEFASHSWGHRNFTTSSFSILKTDCERWKRNVESLLPIPCDTIIYPFGADIAGEEAYTDEVSRFTMLKNFGFRFFCNVDSNMYWVQIGNDYLRQGRRNIDGFRMWEALSGGKNRLSDLFDVLSVFDSNRPTPISQ